MPSSNTRPPAPADVLVVNDRLRVPLHEFQFIYSRSSGPGGQNVNKVNTKVQLRWPVASSPSLPGDVRARLVAKCRRRISVEGDLIIGSQRYRDQRRNVEDCLEKLRELIAAAATTPAKRKPSKPSRGSVQRRLEAKRQRTLKKQRRQPPAKGE